MNIFREYILNGLIPLSKFKLNRLALHKFISCLRECVYICDIHS